MMNCWAGLRRRALCAVLGAAFLLAGCGGGASSEAFVPKRLIVLGDETSVLNSDGSKYSVNALSPIDNSLLDCQSNPLWVQILANSYSLPFQECQKGTATVSTGGLATGVAGGSPVTITAKSDSISGAAVMRVTTATLVSIQVTPSTKSVAAGTTQQFTATGTFSDSTTQDLTSEVAWTSSAPGTATVSAGGLATGIAAGGPVTIAATSGSLSSAASLTVSSATLVSIQVTPGTKSIAAGTTQQFTATGTFSDSTTQDLTSAAAWTSSAPATATISAAGLARGAATGGPVTITATSGSISGTANLTVAAAALVSIQVAPATKGIAAGTTQQFTATGSFTDSTTQDLTTAVVWTSSAPGSATVSAGGLATAVAAGGPVTMSATSGSVSGAASLTITSATLKSIQVTPSTKNIASGTAQQFTATGTFSDATTQDLTSAVAWTSSAPGTATVSATGLATGVAAGGPVTITATSGSISVPASLTVTSATLVSIQVTPATKSLAAGTAQQFTATGTFSDSTTQDLTSAVSWTSSAPGTATVSSGGLARGSAAGGPLTITATSGSISGTASLTVTSATLVSIQVTPTTKTIAAGTTQQFTATGIYTDSTTKDLTAAVKWTSSATDRGPVTAHIFAKAGAQVSDIAAQIDSVGGFVDKDLVTVLAGANDILAQYALIKSGDQEEGSCTSPPNPVCTGAMGVLHSAGHALAAQVNRIADLGGKVLISTLPELGLTPFALSEEALTPGRAAMLTRLTKEFNLALRVNIVNDGRRIGLLLIDETVQAVVKNPAGYGLINVKDAVCIAGLAPTACTTLTLVSSTPPLPPATASNYLWANDHLFSSSGHSMLGSLAYSRASHNPF